MKEIGVTFVLDDSQAARLAALTKALGRRRRRTPSVATVFREMMTDGSVYDIDEKLAVMEYAYKLRQEWPVREKIHEETRKRLEEDNGN